MKLKILVILIIAFVVIQFVPYGRDHSNPAVVAEPTWDSPQTRETFFKLCADCHSNETVWPFYSYIAPVSWLIQSDVDEGREHFNISMWNAQKKNEGDKAVEEYNEGEMPPLIYQLPRPYTKLSDADRTAFIKGLLRTFGERRKNIRDDDEDDD